jgi:hypothetical protein
MSEIHTVIIFFISSTLMQRQYQNTVMANTLLDVFMADCWTRFFFDDETGS